MKVPTELLPCPFCGGTNMLVLPRTCDKNTPYDPNDRAMPAVRCMTCYGEAVGKDWTGPETAIAAWNRRTPSSELLELREAVKPFAALYTESMRDFPDGTAKGERPDDRHAWGFNNANLLWGDFRRAARSLQSHNTGEEVSP